MNKLNLDPKRIENCRQTANKIAKNIHDFIHQHTTVTIERTVCRLLGIDGVDKFDVPIVNLIVDDIKTNGDLGLGVSTYLSSAIKATGLGLPKLIENYLEGKVNLTGYPLLSKNDTISILYPYYNKKLTKIKNNRNIRTKLKGEYPNKETQIYVIVATGNIYEDVVQAKAAAKAGADIIAVIRSTGQSLLDYVPFGITTEGFGGTYATQANFKLMREALDEVAKTENRYISLVNYASGLCMPEIAAMAALERLDILLNDSLYGIIFRDINMQRTFIDQYFSRLINAYAGIIINTGEDNYLTTSDAVEEAHTVLASQFINEAFAKEAYLDESLMGLGHAFEIDPLIKDSFLLELAQAQMAREIFPNAPLKYMPPTKHITGNIFRAYQQNTMFNMITNITGQSIHLLGMMTEAIHTPFMSDRYLAIENAKLVQNALASFKDEISFKPGGLIETRAKTVLENAEALLTEVHKNGLFKTLEMGVFAGVKRPYTGGKGLDGVVTKKKEYINVIALAMEGELNEDQTLR
ncbi:MAG: lysine 5,6-aminomutase subunit alpha [Candidatus Izemoplasmatales bacterium]|nr:lysine 5,6-aminomutase subunit alpha [Candidatus Izemoplasmatales bacterium]